MNTEQLIEKYTEKTRKEDVLAMIKVLRRLNKSDAFILEILFSNFGNIFSRSELQEFISKKE